MKIRLFWVCATRPLDDNIECLTLTHSSMGFCLTNCERNPPTKASPPKTKEYKYITLSIF